MRAAWWLTLLWVGVLAASAQDEARSFAVPAGAARHVLPRFITASGVQLIYDPAQVGAVWLRGVRGEWPPSVALERLLAGSSLTAVRDELSGAIALAPKPRPSAPPVRPPAGGPRATVEKEPAAAGVMELGELIVTGRGRPDTRLGSAFTVSTIDANRLDRMIPPSPTGLVRTLPGLWAETSGGEGGNNLAIRGLPSSNFFFVGFFEDGLPNFQEQQLSFGNADVFLRVDATIAAVEALLGGPASIFASNSPGANINFITKKGTATPEGLVRLTLSDYGQVRWDGVYSGPLAPGLTGSLGGFHRVDDGQRPAGFTANRGGQLRASLTRTFARARVTAYVRRLADRTVFYVPLPLADPRDPSRSLAGLIDPLTGTLTSNDLRRVRLRTLDPDSGAGRIIEADLADGIHTDLLSLGVIVDADVGAGWHLTEHYRHVSATIDFNGIFSAGAPEDAAAFLARSRLRAEAAWGGDVVAAARYTFAHGRGPAGDRRAFDPASTGGLITTAGWWLTQAGFRNDLNDLRAMRSFDSALGAHDVTLGLYTSRYRYWHSRYHNTLLLELRSQPRALDIEMLDAAGRVVGTVTEDGFLGYGTSNEIGGLVDALVWAPYVADTWRLGNRWELDAGVRWHHESIRGYRRLRTTRDLGDAGTLADDAVGGDSGARESRRVRYDEQSLTLGAHHALTDRVAAYVRATSTFRAPDPAVIYVDASREVTRIVEAEAGLKWGSRAFSAVASVFANALAPVAETALFTDAAGVMQTRNYRARTRARGIETELAWRPSPWFELTGNVTVQSSTYSDFRDVGTGALIDGIDGRQVRRIPRFMANVQPRAFFPFLGRRGEVSLELYHAGERFADSANETALPAYTTLGAGFALPITERLTVQAAGTNLTNAVGLTEGNPRLDGATGQGTREAIYGRPIFGRSFQAALTYRF